MGHQRQQALPHRVLRGRAVTRGSSGPRPHPQGDGRPHDGQAMTPKLVRAPAHVEALAQRVRNRDTIDAELRLIASVRRALRELGAPMPSAETVDQLDERAAGKSGAVSA